MNMKRNTKQQRTNSDHIKGAVLTLSGGACWGLSGSMGQFLFNHEGMDVRWLVPIRLGMAGILLLIYCFIKSGAHILDPWKNHSDRSRLLIYGLAGVSACQFLYFTTIQLSSAGAATLLQDLAPAMILLISCFLAKRRPEFLEILAIFLALFGVFLLSTGGDITHMQISPQALATGVLSSVCVTIYNMIPGKLMKRYSVLLLQGWSFLMGSIAIAIIFRSWNLHYVPTAVGWFGIAFVVLVGNVLAFPLYIQGLKYIGPNKGSLYGFSEPVTAAVISTVFLGSPFTFTDGIGFAAIFLMLILISVAGKKH
jgi:drug/metabolite transporter (DMT)-like permease